jgi:ferric-dicitrate binding protein FerR (iron transport regulator)
MKEDFISDSVYEAMVAYFESKLTQVQAEELIAWIGENNNNLRYFLDTEKIWYASGMIKREEKDTGKAWKKLVEKIDNNNIRPMPKPVIHIRISSIYKIASIILILIAVGVGSIFVFRNPEKFSRGEYFEAVAPKGSRSVITLSDGSVVWLNSDTKIKYQADFGQNSRNVILEGEAFFNVSENKEIPFRVHASELCITALGTSFNVKAYSDENIIETTLETGEIRIDKLDGKQGNSEAETVFLKPNQKAVFLRNISDLTLDNRKKAAPVKKNEVSAIIKPLSIKIDSLVDTKLTTSWKDSRWIFKSEKLSKLAPVLERRYDVTITFMDSILVNYKFTGTLKEESLEQVLKALTLAAPIRFEVARNKVYLFEDQEQRSKYIGPGKQQSNDNH